LWTYGRTRLQIVDLLGHRRGDDLINTKNTGTVPTSGKTRLIIATIWRIIMSSRFMPIDHFPSRNSDESEKQSLYPDGDPDRHQNLIIRSLAHCQHSLKISCKSVWKFLQKAANRQCEVK